LPNSWFGVIRSALACVHAHQTSYISVYLLPRAGDERWKARGYALTTVVLSLTTTLLVVQISYAQRNLQTALSEKDVAGFHKALWQFVGIIFVAAPLFATTDFVEARLKVEWRLWLTRQLLHAYFSDRSFYSLKLQSALLLDNPDQVRMPCSAPPPPSSAGHKYFIRVRPPAPSCALPLLSAIKMCDSSLVSGPVTRRPFPRRPCDRVREFQ
jgi:ABC transporter transmembrane region 2